MADRKERAVPTWERYTLSVEEAAEAVAANAELIIRSARIAERFFTLFFMGSSIQMWIIVDIEIHDNYTTREHFCQYLYSLNFL